LLTSDPPDDVRLGRLTPPFKPTCQFCEKLYSELKIQTRVKNTVAILIDNG